MWLTRTMAVWSPDMACCKACHGRQAQAEANSEKALETAVTVQQQRMQSGASACCRSRPKPIAPHLQLLKEPLGFTVGDDCFEGNASPAAEMCVPSAACLPTHTGSCRRTQPTCCRLAALGLLPSCYAVGPATTCMLHTALHRRMWQQTSPCWHLAAADDRSRAAAAVYWRLLKPAGSMQCVRR